MSARVQALGSAMPDGFVFKQSEIVESFFARQPGWDPAWAEVFAASGVERRASVVDPSWYARPRSTADRMREFVPAARRLGAEAARRALERAGPGAASEVGDLLAVSCTGYSGPGLDVHLVDDLGGRARPGPGQGAPGRLGPEPPGGRDVRPHPVGGAAGPGVEGGVEHRGPALHPGGGEHLGPFRVPAGLPGEERLDDLGLLEHVGVRHRGAEGLDACGHAGAFL